MNALMVVMMSPFCDHKDTLHDERRHDPHSFTHRARISARGTDTAFQSTDEAISARKRSTSYMAVWAAGETAGKTRSKAWSVRGIRSSMAGTPAVCSFACSAAAERAPPYMSC